MADAFPWILVAVLVLLAVLALGYWLWKKGKKRKTNYKTFFYIGIAWMAMGLSLALGLGQPSYYGLFAMGAVFAVLGWLNRGKWKEDESCCCWPAGKWGWLLLGILVLALLALAYFEMAKP